MSVPIPPQAPAQDESPAPISTAVPALPVEPAVPGARRPRNGLLLLFGVAFAALLGILAGGVFLVLGGSLQGLPSFFARPEGPTDTVKLLVASDGLVAVSAESLHAAGLVFETLDLKGLRLTQGGVDVPFLVAGDPSPGSRQALLVFYGQAPRHPDSLYVSENVYWLTSGEAGTPMAEREAPPGVDAGANGLGALHFEENTLFQASAPEGQDGWMWSPLFAGTAVTQSFDAPGATGAQATLVVSVLSISDTPESPDHHVVVRVNSQVVGEERWNGVALRAITVTLPEGLLQPAGNSLGLSAPGDTGANAEISYLDAFALRYPRSLDLDESALAWSALPDSALLSSAGAYTLSGGDGTLLVVDVRDPARPVRLVGAGLDAAPARFVDPSPAGSRYVAARLEMLRTRPGAQVVRAQRPALLAGQAAEGAGADYVAIAPGALASGVQPLLDWRRQQGLSVHLVTVEDIADAYGDGLTTPGAIQAFVAATQSEWQPAPRYVLLVGDASYDYRNYLGRSVRNLVPTQLVYTANSGQTASDVWLTRPEPGARPAVALGRLPVDTPEQLAVLVQKIIAYESAPAGEDWTRRVLLAADDEYEFEETSENLANSLLPGDLQVSKVYFADDEQAHEHVLEQLIAGMAIVNYVGHGSLDVWGDEKVLRTADVPSLSNGGRLPVLVTYTCLNGFFHHPEASSLAESMLWKPDGGIIAAVVPSGRSYTVYQKPLVDAFYQELFSQKGSRLGDALLAAQQDLTSGSGYDEVLLTFNLLGDPALQFITTR